MLVLSSLLVGCSAAGGSVNTAPAQNAAVNQGTAAAETNTAAAACSLYYGDGHILLTEKLSPDQTVRFTSVTPKLEYAVTEEGIGYQPGKEETFTSSWEQHYGTLPAGQYRMVREVRLDTPASGDENAVPEVHYLTAKFTVK